MNSFQSRQRAAFALDYFDLEIWLCQYRINHIFRVNIRSIECNFVN